MLELKHYFKDHFNLKAIAWSILGALIISYSMLWLLHIWEYMSPTIVWFNYQSVTPVQTVYKAWEKLKFLSKVRRYQSINMQRQDTAYCVIDTWFNHKLSTQYRPEQGVELMTPWYKASIWTYDIAIPPQYNSCRMCGNSIGTTSLGYKKIYSYCTDYFLVNQ
jgi:hypothetical protein